MTSTYNICFLLLVLTACEQPIETSSRTGQKDPTASNESSGNASSAENTNSGNKATGADKDKGVTTNDKKSEDPKKSTKSEDVLLFTYLQKRKLTCSASNIDPHHHFVSANANSSGDGSFAKPWNVSTAFAHPSILKPGDTIWIKGGEYIGNFKSLITGTKDAPITIAACPWERVHFINGGTDTYAVKVNRRWTIWQGMEFSNRVNSRYMPANKIEAGGPVCGYSSNIGLNLGISSFADTSYINNYFHDNALGFYSPSVIKDDATGVVIASDLNIEVYGNLSFYNGWDSSARQCGHGFYIQHKDGHIAVENNISFANFYLGLQCYGSSANYCHNVDIIGNTMFNPGSISSKGMKSNFAIDGGNALAGIKFNDNHTYIPDRTEGNSGGYLGALEVQNEDLEITGNYLVGLLTINNFRRLTMQHNHLFTDRSAFWLYKIAEVASTIDYDEYFFASTNAFIDQKEGAAAPRIAKGGTPEVWRTLSGYEKNGKFHIGSLPSETEFIIKANRYDPSRFYLLVYNWPKTAIVKDQKNELSKYIPIGVKYRILDVQNVFGSPVTSGTFAGDMLSLTMSNQTEVMQPQGVGKPAHSNAEFGAYVIELLPD